MQGLYIIADDDDDDDDDEYDLVWIEEQDINGRVIDRYYEICRKENE